MGAWIEILRKTYAYQAWRVAPYMGAWIEIVEYKSILSVTETSLPTWERGLKYLVLMILIIGSWSLPTWERGLKLVFRAGTSSSKTSLPTWERGLKYKFPAKLTPDDFVAPYMGAWIEMLRL